MNWKLTIAAAAGIAMVTATPAYAGKKYESRPTVTKNGCGCTHEIKLRVNAGVGNGSEFGETEADDADPGNSLTHNQAGKNSSKPRSAASGTSMP